MKKETGAVSAEMIDAANSKTTTAAERLGALAPELVGALIALLNRPCADTRARARTIINEADATGYFSYNPAHNGPRAQESI